MKMCLVALLLVVLPSVVMASDLEVEQPWVRSVPPVSPNTAGYFMLHNNSKQERVLVAVSSDVASSVEMHTVVEQDGGMSMQQLQEVKIAADDCVMFEPGGNHIMFIGLKQPLQEGDEVKLTLQFKDGESLSVILPVKRSQDEAHQHHHHHH
ncbi:MAG: copper chaperone PCu(A)C [Ketobacter sp.]|nr:MAG: copper chaperone PCu(A)C [Ketobacter sp.]